MAAVALSVSACGSSAPARSPSSPAAGHPAPCADASLQPDATEAARARAAVLCLLNRERAGQGAHPLIEDPALQAAAEAHSLDMSRRNYFEHDTPEGVQPWMRIARAGYQASLVGENLAWGEGPKSTPAHALRLWLESPGHRANLLEPRYTQTGIGMAFESPDPDSSGRPAVIYTTTFGSAAVSTR